MNDAHHVGNRFVGSEEFGYVLDIGSREICVLACEITDCKEIEKTHHCARM